jgi:hypothetical protein
MNIDNKTMIVDTISKVDAYLKVYGDYNITEISLLNYIYSFLDEGVIITPEDLRMLERVVNDILTKEPLLQKIRGMGGFKSQYYSTVRDGSINLRPIIIEDNNKTLNQVEDLVFTTEHFMSTVNENYFDPEGDNLFNLKILTLPKLGILSVNNISVYKGQEIPFSDIDAELFIYTPEITNESDILDFEFAISDIGSKKYLK